MQHSIQPSRPWYDTEGNRIQAHAGSMFYENGRFYWYGENKEKTHPDSKILHWGMRLYTSVDLYNWQPDGFLLPPEKDPASPLFPECKTERPHLLFNAETGKYICWLKVMRSTTQQLMTVYQAEHLHGPYKQVRRPFKPLGMNSGDFDLVQAPDGKAYLYFERVHSELICADLTEDYTDVTGYYSTHFPAPSPPDVREAPAHFVRGGKQYLFTSGTTGYYPNPTLTAVSESWHGPWQNAGETCLNDRSGTSFNMQVSCVFQHPDRKNLYIAMADRWVPDLRERNPQEYDSGETARKIGKEFRRMFSADPAVRSMPPLIPMPRPNTSLSDYVWLPISFEADNSGKAATPRLLWQDEWKVEDYE